MFIKIDLEDMGGQNIFEIDEWLTHKEVDSLVSNMVYYRYGKTLVNPSDHWEILIIEKL